MTKENPFSRIFDTASNASSASPPSNIVSESSSEYEPKRKGRPRGKKSDPEYEAAIAYIRKKTHLQVKRLLLDKEEKGEKQDFSELIQELLDFWVLLQLGEDPNILISRFSDIQKSKNP